MNQLNRHLAPDIETVYVMASPQVSFVSSSGVKEIAAFGGDISALVPEPVGKRSRSCSRTAARARPRIRASSDVMRTVYVHHGDAVQRTAVDTAAGAACRDEDRMLVGFDRSGYGEAPRRHGRSVADVVDEVVALADARGIDRFATWGISGGGPHALACAALLPDRVIAAAAIGSPAPRDADGLDWYAGFGEGNVIEFNAAEHGDDGAPAAARARRRRRARPAAPRRSATGWRRS